MFFIIVNGELKPLAKEMTVPRKVPGAVGGKPAMAKAATLFLVEEGTRVNTKIETACHDSIVVLYGSTFRRVAMYEFSILKASFIVWDMATNDKFLVLWIEKLPDGEVNLQDMVSLSE